MERNQNVVMHLSPFPAPVEVAEANETGIEHHIILVCPVGWSQFHGCVKFIGSNFSGWLLVCISPGNVEQFNKVTFLWALMSSLAAASCLLFKVLGCF